MRAAFGAWLPSSPGTFGRAQNHGTSLSRFVWVSLLILVRMISVSLANRREAP